jgi:hypothetical protein
MRLQGKTKFYYFFGGGNQLATEHLHVDQNESTDAIQNINGLKIIIKRSLGCYRTS